MDWYTINRLSHHHPHHPPIKMTLTYFVGQREATFLRREAKRWIEHARCFPVKFKPDWWEKEKSHGRILLARLADRFRSPWKQTSEETMERVFCSSDFPIFPLDLLCLIVMYLKGTILLSESYLCILLVCFVGSARSSSVVWVNGRTVIVLPLPAT
jgi:hypothetical protein